MFRWFVRPLLAAGFMGAWCRLLFNILLESEVGELTAAAICAVLGAILYSAALLAQGLSVTDLARKLKRAVART